MSESEKSGTEAVSANSRKRFQYQTFSFEDSPKSTPSQTTISFNTDSLHEIDKLARSAEEYFVNPLASQSQETFVLKTGTSARTPSPTGTIENLDSLSDNSANSVQTVIVSHEQDEDTSMDFRKQSNQMVPGSNRMENRASTDLERKKLEAELKAAEEIAKIKQMVIEKRLALELATLQDGADLTQNMRPSQIAHRKESLSQVHLQKADLRTIEETAARKQSLIENNLTEELDSLDLQNRMRTLRSPPAPPIPTRARNNDLIKPSLKPDFLMPSSSDIRNTTERKMLPLGIRISNHRELRTPLSQNLLGSDESKYMSPLEVRYMSRVSERNISDKNLADRNISERNVAERNMSEWNMTDRNMIYGTQGQPGCSEYKNPSVWKTVMMKIKKKFKVEKDPESWQ